MEAAKKRTHINWLKVVLFFTGKVMSMVPIV